MASELIAKDTVTVMHNELSSTFLNKGFEISAPIKNDCDGEHLANTIRKIGLIATYIDLSNLRVVIDEVLCEVEAENETENLLMPAFRSLMPQERQINLKSLGVL